MSPKPAGAFRGGRWSLGFVLVILAWSFQARAADDEISLDLGSGTLELRRIPKGTFTQGSPTTEPGHEPEESLRSVTITRPFWLGKVPVTRAQFSRFVTETRFVTQAEKSQSGGFGWDGKALVQKKEFTWRNPGFPQKDEDPVVLVTFGDANAFTAWASRKSGRRVRLPTEAEWEYAARAGTTTPWYGASKEDEAIALGWFKPNASSSTHPVGTKRPNAFGLFDMTGNVYQWCRDVYAGYPPGEATDPESTSNPNAEPERRILRGGSWLRDVKRGRSAARNRLPPGTRNADNGFRIAMDDESFAAPAAGAVPTNDVAPAGPGSSSIPTPSPSAVASAVSASPASAMTPPRSSNEGGSWSLFAAPLASAAAVVAWVLARRRRDEPESVDAPTRIGGAAKFDGDGGARASVNVPVSVSSLASVKVSVSVSTPASLKSPASMKSPVSVNAPASVRAPVSVATDAEKPSPLEFVDAPSDPHRAHPRSSRPGPAAPAPVQSPESARLSTHRPVAVAILTEHESMPAFEAMPLSLPADAPSATSPEQAPEEASSSEALHEKSPEASPGAVEASSDESPEKRDGDPRVSDPHGSPKPQ
jgi:formylglycine-generating enzyme required for sulfatase activity